MRIAFLHQNMPGQYRGLMPHYASNPKNEVIGIGEADNIRRNFMKYPEGLKLLGYQMPKIPPYAGHPYMRHTDPYIYRGEVVARVLTDLKSKGFSPDVICAHPGWGETLFVKDVFPDARLINYCEFFYHSNGQDFAFDPEFPEPAFSEWSLRIRNCVQLVSLQSMDIGISPTAWQASRYPVEYQPRIAVVHEGVKTHLLVPNPEASMTIKDKNLTLTAKDEIITFVNRNFEPYRGFHIFMRALPEILARRPNAHVIMIGGDEVSYGKQLAQGTYRQWMMNQVGSKLDMSRVHFVGKIPYNEYVGVLQLSTAHVYLTYPFVLSWSMLEAMSVGCLIIGSKTAPVEEVLKHEDNGLLVDFFSQEQLIDTVERACKYRNDMMEIRKRARQTIVEKYDFETVCLPKHFQLIEQGLSDGLVPAQRVTHKSVVAPATAAAKINVQHIPETLVLPASAPRKIVPAIDMAQSPPVAETPATAPAAAPTKAAGKTSAKGKKNKR